MPLDTSPDQAFLDKVHALVKDRDGFQDADKFASGVLATTIWRQDKPITKARIDADNFQFADDDNEAMEDFLDRLETSLEDDEGDEGTVDASIPSQHSEGVINMNNDVLTALGLPLTATSAQVVEAIGAIKASTFTEAEKLQLADVQKTHRVNFYMEEIGNLAAVAGTTKELAEKAYAMEIAISPAASKEQITAWKTFQTMADENGLTKSILSSYNEGDGEADKPVKAKISAFAEKESITFEQALVRQDGGTIAAYRLEVNS